MQKVAAGISQAIIEGHDGFKHTVCSPSMARVRAIDSYLLPVQLGRTLRLLSSVKHSTAQSDTPQQCLKRRDVRLVSREIATEPSSVSCIQDRKQRTEHEYDGGP